MSEAGIAAFRDGRWVQAIAAFQSAVKAAPDDPWNRLNLARACFNLKDFVACHQVLRGLLRLPDLPEQARFEAQQLRAYVAPFDAGMDDAALLRISRDWAGALHARHGEPPAPPPWQARDRLHVGFLCAHFGAPVDYLPVGLLDRDAFRVTGYGVAARPVARSPGMPRFDHYRDLAELDDAAAAARIREDGVDILVDLGGQGWGQRNGILFQRPAPLRIGWSNRLYPASAALVDWVLGDWITHPAGAERREEARLWRLAEPVLPVTRLQPPPDAGHPAADAPLTFGSVASPFKLNDACMALWAQVLRQVPDSRFLYAMEHMSADQAAHVARLFGDVGIAGDRLELRPLPAGGLPAAVNDMDLVLDSIPFTANFTAWQAAAQGAPMVTLRGDRYAGRMAASVLTGLGRPDWVAETPDQYVDLALVMAGQVRGAAGQRAARAARARAARLAEPGHAARVLGRALQAIWEAERSGAAPAGCAA